MTNHRNCGWTRIKTHVTCVSRQTRACVLLVFANFYLKKPFCRGLFETCLIINVLPLLELSVPSSSVIHMRYSVDPNITQSKLSPPLLSPPLLSAILELIALWNS
ncbi:hypothetical protein Leryth_014444 [Lithospermum erythrorhizon]|nr:hypothetical protein Leryth_014444 [Lithospermum erythrorhizon]